MKEIFFFFGGGGGGGRGGGGTCLWISIHFFLSDGECYHNDKTIFSTSSVMLLSGLKIHHH